MPLTKKRNKGHQKQQQALVVLLEDLCWRRSQGIVAGVLRQTDAAAWKVVAAASTVQSQIVVQGRQAQRQSQTQGEETKNLVAPSESTVVKTFQVSNPYLGFTLSTMRLNAGR